MTTTCLIGVDVVKASCTETEATGVAGVSFELPHAASTANEAAATAIGRSVRRNMGTNSWFVVAAIP